ncbi:AAA family ATPase [Micromonospora sp. CP22]|uniref:AAA family ATPase n=1 Tax=Micromonospora sp. CP22 TaxID=2580517 RepID=UPI0018AD1338|nr:AAA family ATPase [Micromonospora sp. CP22]
MTDSKTAVIDQRISDHLDRSDLPEIAKDLIVGALCGEDYLTDVLGGAASPPPRPSVDDTEAPEPIGTYLKAIEVTGFRGIGPTATLDLVPGPGLTIVTGRNGSGKSSFAEAAEFALTGENKRWAGRSTVWRKDWRNLHAPDTPRIRVRLGVEGHRDGAVVECNWASDAKLTDVTTFLQMTGQPRRSIADLGWDKPLQLYRPFLSYSELSGLFDKPSELHDSLQNILGLRRLGEIENMLKAARRETDQQRTRGKEALPALRAALAEHPDQRARLAEQALTARAVDLDRLEALTTSDDAADDKNVVPLRQLDVLRLPSRDDVAAMVGQLRVALRQIEDLAGTPADEARALAGLLRDALRHRANHPDQPCPVCQGRILDEAWTLQAQEQLQRLTQRAEQLESAHGAERELRRLLRDQVPVLPHALSLDLSAEQVHTEDARMAWQGWDDLLAAGDAAKIVESAVATFDALLTTLNGVQIAARKALERRRQVWQPIADQLRTWIDTERASRHAATMHAALKKAVAGLLKIGEQIRHDELAPVAAEATEIWNMLRQDSNVQLGEIALAGTGPSRRADLDVQVDGIRAAALSVMSQGELHSLALALFLPRATRRESPFRFLVIDDPVQSMDPAKVYGLAQLLTEVAKRRQVIVFTHDDRLPSAVRHLQLDARILTVSRKNRSEISVTGARDGDPGQRYLTDARAILSDQKMASKLKNTIVCNLIRDALEYACHERIRIRAFRAGTSIVDTEAAISETEGLRATLALALLGDRQRIGELRDALRKFGPDADEIVTEVNRGTHGGATGDLHVLIDKAGRLVERLGRP